MRSLSKPVWSAVKGRFYSAQAAAEQVTKVNLSKQDAKISRLANGTVVASVENTSPVSKVAAIFNAGSRYETKKTEGVTHALRCAANLSNKTTSAFGLARGVQQIGGSFSTTTSREHVMISMDVMRDNVVDALKFISEASFEAEFLQWEVDRLKPRMEFDVSQLNLDSNLAVFEALHKAAYRDTLGMGLYCPQHKIAGHSPDSMRAFFSSHYRPSNMAYVATGFDHEELTHTLQHTLGFGKGSPEDVPNKVRSTYHGGEQRIETTDSIVHAAVVTQGASLGSKDLIPLALLQKVMSAGPSVKYSAGGNSKLSQAASKVASGPFSVNCINVNYSDSGLFGFYVVGQSEDAGSLLKSCMAQFGTATKQSAITEEELKRAKNQLKASVHMSLEDSSNVLADLAAQALLTGQVLNPAEIGSAIDKTTVAEVQAVAKKVINGKPAMAAVGNLDNTPYLDQLL